MDSSNNKVVGILDSNHWSDGLLIKDEKGNLRPLKEAAKDNKANNIDKAVTGVVSEGSLAPQDDNFAPMQNIMGSSQTKSELVFHPQDKEELDFFAQNIPSDDSKKYSVEKIVDRIIAKQNLNLDDKNKKIFTNILYNFFRSRKSAVITRELLINGVLIKNKKIPSETIDIILSIIKGIKNKIDQAGGLVVNQAELKAKRDLLPKSISTEDVPIKEKENVLSEEETAKILGKSDKNISVQDEVKMALGELENIKPVANDKHVDKKEVEKSIVTEDIKSKTESPIELSKTTKDSEKKDKLSDESIKEKVSSSIDIAPKDEPKKEEIKPANKKPAEGFAIPTKNEIETPKEETKPAENKKDVDELKKEEAKPEIEETKEEFSLPKVSRPNLNQGSKKAISDVVTPVKEEVKVSPPPASKNILTGAVQELQSFDLVGFRRLGNTAKERAQKIFDKINLLEQESYTKKSQGITAWRSSGVYNLYLELGMASMSAGKEVADFIADKESKNEETLSLEEFSAISDLNKQLRF